MKKLIVIAIAFLSLQAMAQDRQREGREMRKERIQDMTPEELAQLKTKKMTLHLDLDDKQQDKVYDLILEQMKTRKAKLESRKASSNKEERKELSKEERLQLANEKLDAQIAFKSQMKSVLSEEQYKKFEKSLSKGSKRKARKKQKRQ